MRYIYTICYIATIILVNLLFSIVPYTTLQGNIVTPVDILVGSVYVFRDLAQREIKHYVLLAMLVGTGLSYILADKQVALASVCAFFIGEISDWLIYTYTRKPLSDRLLWSSLISAPLDSIVFLYMINSLNPLGLALLMTSKLIGIFAVWYYWHVKHPRQMAMVETDELFPPNSL